MSENPTDNLSKDKNTYEKIAQNVTFYLKNRMILNQGLINSNDITISYNDYINGLNNVLNTKDSALIYRYFTRYKNNIILTEEQIDELMAYIKLSIEKHHFGFQKNNMTESEFIVNLLNILITDNQLDIQNRTKLDNWIKFFATFLSENCGFANEISSSINIERKCAFSIINHDCITVYAVNEDGLEIANKLSEPERIIIGSNIYEGALHTGSTSSLLSVFLAKTEDGNVRMNPILFGNVDTLYDVKPNEDNQFVGIFNSFDDDLRAFGLDPLIKRVYSKNEFISVYVTYLKYKNLCSSAKQRIDILTNEAAEICTNVVLQKIRENFFGENYDKFISRKSDEVFDVFEEDRVRLFKEILRKYFKIDLLNASKVEIGFNPYVERRLQQAATKAGVDIIIPKDFKLLIANDKIYVNFNITGDSVNYGDMYIIFDSCDLNKEKSTYVVPIYKPKDQQSS